MPQQRWTIQDRSQFKQQWAADRLTLVDFAAITAGGGLAELIDETVGSFPEIRIIGMRSIKGLVYKQSVRTQRPTVGFRNANEGVDAKRSVYESRMFNCHIFNPRWEVDKAAADGHEDGASIIIAEEAAAILESSWEHIGKQMYYGSGGAGNDSKGFAGLLQIYNTAMEVNAAGTVDEDKSSAWALRLTRNQSQFILGNDSQFDISDVAVRDVFDANNKPFEAYVQSMLAHIGFKVSDLRSVGRIKNLTEESGKGLTGARAAQLKLTFPTNQKPTHLFCNETQAEQYRLSKVTPENPDPPMPTTIQGMELVITDSIVNGHALEIA